MTELTRRSKELTADLSHDLRNALSCIDQFGSILVDGLAGELSGQQREYVGIMIENTWKIHKLLNSAPDWTSDLPEESINTSPIEHAPKLNT
jgi:signal transduction histidine kinase